MVASNIADVAFAIQSAKGTPASVSAYRAYLHGGDQPHPNRVNADFEETTGSRIRSDRFVSTMDVAGAPVLYAMPLSLGALLYGVLGGKAVSGGGDPYTHTFTNAATLPYFTFWRMLANGLYEEFDDCVITHLNIHGEYGLPLTVTPTIMGLTPSYQTSAEATAAIEKTNRFMHRDASAALLFEGSATPTRCTRMFDLDIDNGATVYGGDSLTPCDVTTGLLTATLAYETLLSDFALYNRLQYASATPADSAAVTDTVLELAGSPAGIDWKWTRVAASRTLEVLLPRVLVEPFVDQPDIAGGPLVRTVTLTAVQPASGSAVTAKVLNAQASY